MFWCYSHLTSPLTIFQVVQTIIFFYLSNKMNEITDV